MKQILKHQVLRNFSSIFTGTLISQAILAITPIFLARFYSPEAFGIAGLITGVATLAGALASLEFTSTINIAETEYDANILLKISRKLGNYTFVFYLAVSAIILAASNSEKIQQIGFLIFFIPVWAYLLNLFNSFREHSARFSNFNPISLATIIKSFSISVTQLLFALIYPKAIFLLFGRIAGEAIGSIYFSVKNTLPKKSYSKDDLKRVFKKYETIAIYGIPSRLLNNFSKNALIYAMSVFYSLKTVGFYTIAMKVVQAPAYLIAENMKKVFESRTSKYRGDNSDLRSFTFKTTLILFALALPICFILFNFSTELFTLLLGNGWEETSLFVKWLSLLILPIFLSEPYISLFKVFNRVKARFLFDFIEFLFSFGVIVISGIYLNEVDMIKLFVLNIYVFSTIKVFYILKLLK